LSDTTAAYLIERAEAVPYDIQKIAKATWAWLVDNGQKTVTEEVIAAACQTLIEEDGDIYLRAWNQLPASQKIALGEVAPTGKA
jgi:hypothetical protein